MRTEAEHMRQFAEMTRRDTRVVVPAVIDQLSTQQVLVMTYIEGANVRDAARLDAWHVNREQVRDTLVDLYVRQVLGTGFVHLDPHPGNLSVLQDGRLALLDFGMVAEYGEGERKAFRRLIQSVLWRDGTGVAETLQELGYLRSDVDAREFASDVRPMMGQLDRAFVSALWTNESFRLEARYMLLLRCLGLLKSVLTTLTPDESDWFGVISEHVLPVLESPIQAHM